MYTPAAVGVPLIVIVLLLNVADTPGGKPVGEPIPVDPVVEIVIGVREALIQIVGLEEGGATVLAAVILIVPVALTVPHPPVSGTV